MPPTSSAPASEATDAPVPAPAAPGASALRAWLMLGRQAAVRRGIDADALLREAGLDPGADGAPLAQCSARQALAFWQQVVRAAGDELLGVEVARESVPLSLSALGYALAASATLRQMYARLARYAHVVTDVSHIRFELRPGCGVLTVAGDGAVLAAADAATVWSLYDYAMLSVVRGSRMLFGRDFRPLELRLQRPRPGDAARFEKAFRCTPLYGCADNALVVDEPTLDRPLSFADGAVVQASEAAMERLRPTARPASASAAELVDQVAALVQALLPEGEPRQADIAARLGLSERSLQRHLAARGTSFRMLLRHTRRELALHHLGDPTCPVGEVAARLGFSEVSAFTRAFKSWTGTSPRAWRRQAGR